MLRQRKDSKRKATTLPLAFGFPIVQDKKWESLETRFAQTARLSLSIFCLAQLAVSEVDESQKQSQQQDQKQQQKQSVPTDVHFSNSSCWPLILLLIYPRSRLCNLCFTENG
nr:hypothetical protein [uncultured Undibacterium sp.]